MWNTDGQTDLQNDGHHQSISWDCFEIRPIKHPCYTDGKMKRFVFIDVIIIYNKISPGYMQQSMFVNDEMYLQMEYSSLVNISTLQKKRTMNKVY